MKILLTFDTNSFFFIYLFIFLLYFNPCCHYEVFVDSLINPLVPDDTPVVVVSH